MRNVSLVVRPLMEWPGQLRASDDERLSPQFSASWENTVDILHREAEFLGATQVVLQVALRERDIRIDGWIKANAKPSHPGVTIVLPESDQGRISFSTDVYRGKTVYRGGSSRHMPGWHANVRAIALSMEALRAADRHGIMQGRQYAGFKELGAGSGPTSVHEAARLLIMEAGLPVDNDTMNSVIGEPDYRSKVHRDAARRTHPDQGGDAERFLNVQQALSYLNAQKGITA